MSWSAPSPDTLAAARRVGALIRVDTSPVLRLWTGAVRPLAVPAGGAETVDGAQYLSAGMLQNLPALSMVLNGDAERVAFTLSGIAVTGELASIVQGQAQAIRGVAVDVGLALFDEDWQLIPPLFWAWSYTADSLTISRTGDPLRPTRTLQLSCASVFAGRRQPNLSFLTAIDQARRSADDVFFDQVGNYSSGTTKVWGVP